MAIIPWKPFWDIDRFFEELDPWRERMLELFEGEMRLPRMDLFRENGNLVAEFEMPGVSPEDVQVEIQDGVLRVRAQRKEEKEEKERGYYRKEIRRAEYNREVILPEEVEEGKITAEMGQDGILRVLMPVVEREESKARQIKVKKKSKK